MRRLDGVALTALAAVAAGCGYRSLAGAPTAEKLAVVMLEKSAVDAMTASAVLTGVREALVDEGAYAPGTGYPRIEVEVTADDYGNTAIEAQGGIPVARSTEAHVVARAKLVRAQGEPAAWDSRDMSAYCAVPSAASPEDLLRTQVSGRCAAHAVGRKLGAAALGDPAASESRAPSEARR
jgi:hypothetical protein